MIGKSYWNDVSKPGHSFRQSKDLKAGSGLTRRTDNNVKILVLPVHGLDAIWGHFLNRNRDEVDLRTVRQSSPPNDDITFLHCLHRELRDTRDQE